MYQPWQKDTSMEAVMELIEERERREVANSYSHRHNYNPHHSESGNWGIMSLNDTDAPTRPSNHSFTGNGRGELEGSRRREPSWSPGRRDGRELVPVAQWGLEIASRLTEQMRAGRARSSSSEGERRAPRLEWRQDTPDTRTSTNERQRRSSRSDAEGRKRRRSDSRSNRDVSGSRDGTRCRSRSRDKTRRSSSRDRKHNSSGTGDKRSNSREWKRHGGGSGYNKRDKRRDRSSSTERNTRSVSRDERDLSSACESPVQSSATIRPKQTATPAAADASDILSKFISIIKDVKEQPQSKKIPRNDVIPEFDPLDKANAIVTWITRVDDIAKLFGWEQSETLQYAMPKLTGLARAWYLGRKDFIHSWADWKKKLVEQFPCPDYWQMLDELKQRQCSDNEALENYFHDKIILVKRCGIRGRQAVECVLQGVRDEPVRLFAAAAQLDQPEDLLTFLKTAETIRKKVSTVATPAAATTTPASTAGSKNNGKPQCSICNKFGHLEAKCFIAKRGAMKVIQCKTCNKYGHKSTVCWYKVKTDKIPAKTSKKIKAPKLNSQKQCFSCGLIGHKESACQIAWHKVAEGMAKKKCFCCNEVGHLINACPHRDENETRASVASAPHVAEMAPGPGGADVSSHEPPPPGVEEH